MNSHEAFPPSKGSVDAGPLDCSEDLYRFYLETVDADGTAGRVLRSFLGPRREQRLRRLPHGFEFVSPIQCVPDLIRFLKQGILAVYQAVRQGKAEGEWR